MCILCLSFYISYWIFSHHEQMRKHLTLMDHFNILQMPLLYPLESNLSIFNFKCLSRNKNNRNIVY